MPRAFADAMNIDSPVPAGSHTTPWAEAEVSQAALPAADITDIAARYIVPTHDYSFILEANSFTGALRHTENYGYRLLYLRASISISRIDYATRAVRKGLLAALYERVRIIAGRMHAYR
jgi:hypothetical protein